MGSMRRRKNTTNSSKDVGKSDDSKEEIPSSSDKNFFVKESVWGTIRNHWSFPLYGITMAVLLPYLLYKGYMWILLERPDLLHNFNIFLRPAVPVTGERQLLIVGTMSSGTKQVEEDLGRLGLEIGHENADASSYFVRDGTVSWFHGTRFMKRSSSLAKTIDQLCYKFAPNMGFHPSMYRASERGCSSHQTWSQCWRSDCAMLLLQEWGCERDDNTGFAGELAHCQTPFRYTLHQVRHPLHTIQSLVTKFCIDGVDGRVQPAFVTFGSAIFPDIDFESLSCIEAAGYYVVNYNRAMMNVGLPRFHVEDTTPCDIVRMAGFLSSETSVYDGNLQRLNDMCNDPDDRANKVMVSTANQVNNGQLSLAWKDLLGGVLGSNRTEGDQTLVKLVQSLTKDLGYSLDIE